MAEVRIVSSDELTREELQAVRLLLEEAFEGGFSDDDWAHTVGGLHVLVHDGELVSHAAVVERPLAAGDRVLRAAYVEGVATAPAHRSRGHGSTAMRAVADIITTRGYELGVLSTGLHDFYSRLGWERWHGPTFVRTAAGLERTEEDDDSIMFLRIGPSADIDPALPLVCEWRPGDVW